jgi:archaellum component FlaF (FlaF/FlaG flagellin family)
MQTFFKAWWAWMLIGLLISLLCFIGFTIVFMTIAKKNLNKNKLINRLISSPSDSLSTASSDEQSKQIDRSNNLTAEGSHMQKTDLFNIKINSGIVERDQANFANKTPIAKLVTNNWRENILNPLYQHENSEHVVAIEKEFIKNVYVTRKLSPIKNDMINEEK